MSIRFFSFLWILFSFFLTYTAPQAPFQNISDNPAFQKCFQSVYVEWMIKNRPQVTNETDSLYNEFVKTRILPQYSQKELDPSLSLEDREKATEDRIRQSTAYMHQKNIYNQWNSNRVQSNSATYYKTGIDTFVARVPNLLVMGKSSLTKHLCSATTNAYHITAAQDRQKFFENNEDIAYSMATLLHEAQKGEEALLDLWNNNKSNQTKHIMKNYKTSIPLLTDSASAGNLSILFNTSAEQPFFMIALPHLVSALKKDSFINTLDLIAGRKYQDDALRSYYKLMHQDRMDKIEMSLRGSSLFGLVKMITSQDTWQKKTAKGILYALSFLITTDNLGIDPEYKLYADATIATGLAAIDCHSLYEKRSSKEETTIHQSLIDAANYVRSAEKMHSIIKNNSALQVHFPDFCSTYEKVRDGEKTKSIIADLLTTNTFAGSPSAFSNVGRIALVSDRIVDVKEEFMPLMNALGEIDKYLALTRYKKDNTTTPFIYTEPTSSAQPFVKGKDFVHPAHLNFKPINTITLRSDTTSINGPNGFGKSSAMRNVAANIILKQVFGIAFAQEFNTSAFDEVIYTANVEDRLGEESQYEAEVRIMKEVYRKLRQAEIDGTSGLYICDEPLSATNGDAGAEALQHFIKRIKKLQKKNNLFVFITHHNLPESDNVKTYHVQKGRDKYTIAPGKSDYTNAKQLLKAALDEIDAEFTSS